jgi:hypothetical protein
MLSITYDSNDERIISLLLAVKREAEVLPDQTIVGVTVVSRSALVLRHVIVGA